MKHLLSIAPVFIYFLSCGGKQTNPIYKAKEAKNDSTITRIEKGKNKAETAAALPAIDTIVPDDVKPALQTKPGTNTTLVKTNDNGIINNWTYHTINPAGAQMIDENGHAVSNFEVVKNIFLEIKKGATLTVNPIASPNGGTVQLELKNLKRNTATVGQDYKSNRAINIKAAPGNDLWLLNFSDYATDATLPTFLKSTTVIIQLDGKKSKHIFPAGLQIAGEMRP